MRLCQVTELSYQIIYPPEGNSSILEVSKDRIGQFLLVSLGKNGALTYDFFVSSPFTITEKHLKEIELMARTNLSYTDLFAAELERFDES